MTNAYQAVQWNRHKKIYDVAITLGIVLYVAAFVVVSSAALPAPSGIGPEPILLLRAFATCAFLLLHIVLLIGPLTRLSPRFAPLLYNRRHLGVATFGVALLHGLLSLVIYHGLGDSDPFTSLFAANQRFDSLAQFPFQLLGAVALGILFLMAATSHDFWLKNLGKRFWKAMHMLVYVAYALIVAHVALGALQSERSSVYLVLVLAGAALVLGVHVTAAVVGGRHVYRASEVTASDWVAVATLADIPEDRAKVVEVGDGERIAVFRSRGGIAAVTNVCAHQGGPLGEGKVLDGCVTCPWHGYQFRLKDGQSPPPYTEKIVTHRVRLEGDSVLVDPKPLPKGTPTEPAKIPNGTAAPTDRAPFYVGYLPVPASMRAAVMAFALALPLLMGATAAVVASEQNDPGTGVWHDAEAVAIVGHLQVDPYPTVYIADPSSPDGVRGVLLVTQLKFGVAELARPLDGEVVRVLGTFISRDGRAMFALEDRDDALMVQGGETLPAPRWQRLGSHVLRGEIADSKCFLGAMKPGLGKTHRACAVRCISGGIPPILVTENSSDLRTVYVLAGLDGEAIHQEVLDRVAEPVEIRGDVEKRGDLLVLRVDPKTIRRLED